MELELEPELEDELAVSPGPVQLMRPSMRMSAVRRVIKDMGLSSEGGRW